MKLTEPNIKDTIEGRSIILKPISINEVNDKYVSWLNDTEVNKYLEVRHKKQTIEGIFSYINGLRSKSGHEVFAIFTKKQGIHIGNIAISINDQNNLTLEYGIMIGDLKAQKLGLGAEATILFIEYIFSKTNIRKISEGVIEGNDKSWKLFDLLGFKREATLRQHYILSSGKIADAFRYGILREEWLVARKKYDFLLKHMNIKSEDYE